jgi:hypothetical protein
MPSSRFLDSNSESAKEGLRSDATESLLTLEVFELTLVNDPYIESRSQSDVGDPMKSS